MANDYPNRTTTRAREWVDADRDTLPERMDVPGEPRDEMIPERGQRMDRPDEHDTGEREDTAGSHGRMAPESAAGLERVFGSEEKEE